MIEQLSLSKERQDPFLTLSALHCPGMGNSKTALRISGCCRLRLSGFKRVGGKIESRNAVTVISPRDMRLPSAVDRDSGV